MTESSVKRRNGIPRDFFATIGSFGHNIIGCLPDAFEVAGCQVVLAKSEVDGLTRKGSITVQLRDKAGNLLAEEAADIALHLAKESDAWRVDDPTRSVVLVDGGATNGRVGHMTRSSDGMLKLQVPALVREQAFAFATQVLVLVVVNPMKRRMERALPAELRQKLRSRPVSQQRPSGCVTRVINLADRYDGLWALPSNWTPGGQKVDQEVLTFELGVEETEQCLIAVRALCGDSPHWGGDPDDGCREEMTHTQRLTVLGQTVLFTVRVGELAHYLEGGMAYLREVHKKSEEKDERFLELHNMGANTLRFYDPHDISLARICDLIADLLVQRDQSEQSSAVVAYIDPHDTHPDLAFNSDQMGGESVGVSVPRRGHRGRRALGVSVGPS